MVVKAAGVKQGGMTAILCPRGRRKPEPPGRKQAFLRSLPAFPLRSCCARPASSCAVRCHAGDGWVREAGMADCDCLQERPGTVKPHNHKSIRPNGSRSTAPASGRIGRAHKRRRRRLRARNFANCRPKPALAARQKRGAVGSMRQRVFEQLFVQIRLCRIADKVSSE